MPEHNGVNETSSMTLFRFAGTWTICPTLPPPLLHLIATQPGECEFKMDEKEWTKFTLPFTDSDDASRSRNTTHSLFAAPSSQVGTHPSALVVTRKGNLHWSICAGIMSLWIAQFTPQKDLQLWRNHAFWSTQ